MCVRSSSSSSSSDRGGGSCMNLYVQIFNALYHKQDAVLYGQL